MSRYRRLISMLGLSAIGLLSDSSGRLHATPQRIDPDVAIVFQLSGTWSVVGSPPRPLARGNTLRLGDVISPGPKHSSADFLVAVSVSGKRIEKFTCLEGHDPCQHTLTEGHWEADPESALTRILNLVMRVWKDDPDQFTILGSRGSSLGAREQVVTSSQIVPTLTAIATYFPAGRYRFVLKPILREQAEGLGSIETDEFDVHEGKPNAIHLDWPGYPPPGLYALQYRSLSLVRESKVSLSWVLLTSDESYQQLADQFSAAEGFVQTWPQQVDTSLQREFLRASLLALNNSRQPPPP